MKIDLIVSRHRAAVEFIAAQIDDRAIPVQASATAEDVRGKVVAGNLPLHLAAEARIVIAIEFDGTPPRGVEYTLDDMRAASARLHAYSVRSLEHDEAGWHWRADEGDAVLTFVAARTTPAGAFQSGIAPERGGETRR